MEKCSGKSISSGKPCGSTGWRSHEGKWYCAMHDPVMRTYAEIEKFRKEAEEKQRASR